MVSNIFYFHPYFGKWSNLTNIFQKGWNHHLVKNSLNWLWLSELGHQTGNNSQGLGIASIAWPLREKSKRVRFAKFGQSSFHAKLVGGRIHRAFAAGQVYAWPILQASGVGFIISTKCSKHGKQLEGDDPCEFGWTLHAFLMVLMLCQQVLFQNTLRA